MILHEGSGLWLEELDSGSTGVGYRRLDRVVGDRLIDAIYNDRENIFR